MSNSLLSSINFLLLLLTFSFGFGDDGIFDWDAYSTQPEQAKYVARSLRLWNAENASGEEKPLRVVYFHANDREPLMDYRERWTGILSDVQDFYRAEMELLGYGDVTLSLEKEEGRLKIHEVRGKEEDSSYNYKSGGKIRQEVFEKLRSSGMNPDEETILIVCGLSRTEGTKVTIYSPYYGMGANHQRGICFTADMEWLSIEGLKPDPARITLEVKEHRGFEPFTLGRFNTVYLGGAIHELGHGLSLPHNLATKQEAKRGTALMGAGNYTYRKEWRNEGKGSFLTHSSALRLLAHPLFNGKSKKLRATPSLKFTELDLGHERGQIRLSGKIEPTVPVIAMIAYNDPENKGQRGYMSNNDYDATSWTSILSPDNQFRLKVSDLREGNHQIRLVAVHANGAVSTKRMHYALQDGNFDFTRAQEEINNILDR